MTEFDLYGAELEPNLGGLTEAVAELSHDADVATPVAFTDPIRLAAGLKRSVRRPQLAFVAQHVGDWSQHYYVASRRRKWPVANWWYESVSSSSR